MKFTNGYWLMKEQMDARFAVEYFGHDVLGDTLVVYAATKHLNDRGDTLNSALLTVEFSSPLPGAVRTEIIHHAGTKRRLPSITMAAQKVPVSITEDAEALCFVSGPLRARIDKRPNAWRVAFIEGETLLCETSYRNMAYIRDRDSRAGYMVEQLSIDVGECFYGLGERFTPFVKNGQNVVMWNEDGGTASEIAYKNVPFVLSSKGYGVLVDSMEEVDFEIGSEKVSRMQFSLPGERLAYIIIAGPKPADVLERLTDLTGKPALPPAWSFGLWLSTSFTTRYDEGTVTSFIEGMAERDIPFSVFHFDCFWMKPYQWCDLTWDADTFTRPADMLTRLKARGLKLCVWINPYIAQKSALFAEASQNGFLLMKADGSVWQTDMWQAGMGIVDFTNPGAVRWFQSKLKALLDMGVDCFKTDFGERIPVRDIAWHDGSCAMAMHNFYPYLYNKAVFEVLRAHKEGDACVFARSATIGCQQFPVHWGGDCTASYASMAETLRGGLSLSVCGFAFWSHDIGGFEQTASPDVYKRWCAFGLLSSHSRLHGSASYRVPWLFDDEAVEVLRRFVKLKCKLMPYIFSQAVIARDRGLPLLRPILFDFPDDPACRAADTQYMLGEALLVAPVFRENGEVEYYLPQGRWTNYLTGESIEGGRYRKECHDYFSLPLMVRSNSVLVTGGCETRPDYDYTDGMCIELFELKEGCAHRLSVPDALGARACGVTVAVSNGRASIALDRPLKRWSVLLHNMAGITAENADVETVGNAVHIRPTENSVCVEVCLPGDY